VPTRRKQLWGYTALGPQKINIYKSFRLKEYDGYTTQTKVGYSIDIAAAVFDDPVKIDDTLLHEFIHVIDFSYAFVEQDYKWNPAKQCSHATRLIATGLAQMLRELRQVHAQN
jgi:hypothetical protein